jgi:hypothetical protein
MRKFSESLDNEIDAAYIRQCFADIIDSGIATIEEKESAAYGKWVSMSIDLKEIKSGTVNIYTEFISRKTSKAMEGFYSLRRHIDAYESNNNVYQEVKLALERLADEYPNYKIKVDIFSSVFINFFP